MLLRKTTIFTVLLFAFCLIGLIPCRAQSGKSNVLYAEPTRLMLKGDGKADEEEQKGVLLREKFYPVGWSKDGKFAFFVEPADEACGCYFAHLVIQDLRTDKILWQRKYTGEEGSADTLQTYWKKNQKEFSAKLAQYKITAEKNFTLRDFPLKYKTDALTHELKVDLTEDNSVSVKGSLVLRLISKEKGRKTLYEKTYSAKNYDSIRGAEIGGVLLSPFEPRAAIILIETHRGYEGPPNITRIRIVGTDLEKSFK